MLLGLFIKHAELLFAELKVYPRLSELFAEYEIDIDNRP